MHSERRGHWFVKRLSANDTLANQTHQAGPYLPREFLLAVFPTLNQPEQLNPDFWFGIQIDSHGEHRQARAVWYNNKFHSGTRNETRITNLGGVSSALLNPSSTGAIALFRFSHDIREDQVVCHVWVCQDESEEDQVEDWIGPVDPGVSRVLSLYDQPASDLLGDERYRNCWLEPSEIPPAWLHEYPSGVEFVRKALELDTHSSLPPDDRIIMRRICEFNLFRSVEKAVELPKIKNGFENMESFLTLAQSILQRRKARSGISLEIHAREIFKEEGLLENEHFAYQMVTPSMRRPDFVFPSADAYSDPSVPVDQLRMLAVKTTCRDRWRQILPEDDRDLPVKHLLTVQEGVSEPQHDEMVQHGVRLVVPTPLQSKFPRSIRSSLLTLTEFIQEVQQLDRPPR